MKLSVQEDSEQTRRQISDLQDQVNELTNRIGTDAEPAKNASGREERTFESNLELPDQTPDSTSDETDAKNKGKSGTGGRGLRRVLWVDDYPSNNAYEIEKLKQRGVDIMQASSTSEGLRYLDKHSSTIDAIISDMGREEKGTENPRAGLDLLNEIRDRYPTDDIPVVFYTSSQQVDDKKAEVESLNASITSSPLELFRLLGAPAS